MILETVQKVLDLAFKDEGIARREVLDGIVYGLERVRGGLEGEIGVLERVRGSLNLGDGGVGGEEGMRGVAGAEGGGDGVAG